MQKNRYLVLFVITLFVTIFLTTCSSKGRAFESISIGMTKAEVIKLMGNPESQSDEFRLGQYEGFEEEYKRARQSNAEYYFFWYGKIDYVYTVGFDKKDMVVIKASGGT